MAFARGTPSGNNEPSIAMHTRVITYLLIALAAQGMAMLVDVVVASRPADTVR